MINNIEENIKDLSRNIQNKIKDIVGKKKTPLINLKSRRGCQAFNGIIDE
jgi:hypothetical protein